MDYSDAWWFGVTSEIADERCEATTEMGYYGSGRPKDAEMRVYRCALGQGHPSAHRMGPDYARR